MPRYPALRTVLGWLICYMPVRLGDKCVGMVVVLSFDARLFSKKEMFLLEGLVTYNALPTRALT